MSYKGLNKRKDDLDIDDLDGPKRGEYSLEDESYKSGDKPRSILKENASGTKAGKRIVINENANELHSISKVTSQTSAEKEKETASFRGNFDSKGYSQSDSAGYSPLSKSENSRSGNKYDKYELSDDEAQDKIDYKVDSLKNYANEQISNTYGKKTNYSSETSGQNEFQKAHIRKLQQERESELYGKFLKTSAQKVREKWLEEKQKSTPKSNIQNTDQSKSHQEKSYGDYSGKSLSAVQSADTYSKFSRIENKISDLEKDLESYQKTMKEKYEKEAASQDDFEKAYNRVDSKVKVLKKELDKSLDRFESKQSEELKRKTDDDDDEEVEEDEEEEEQAIPSKGSKGSKRSNLKKSVEFSNIEDRVSSKASPKKKISSAVKSLKKLTTEYDDEVQRLREENEALKRALKSKEYNASRKAPRPQSANKAATKASIEGKIEKERELLKTLDRLKRKVWSNISKKVKDEKDKENAQLKDEIETKTFGRTYVPAPAYGTTYHDVLLTKIYGDHKARKTNAVLLHKGIPVTHGSKKK